MSLSAGSSPLHSPKITPHTSPAPRRRSHTPNPANYMVPTTASDQGTHIIQKETVGGTTYFYTDNTPAPMAGMVCAAHSILICIIVRKYLKTKALTRGCNSAAYGIVILSTLSSNPDQSFVPSHSFVRLWAYSLKKTKYTCMITLAFISQ